MNTLSNSTDSPLHHASKSNGAIALFSSVKSTVPSEVIDLQSFIDGIKDGRWREEVDECRLALEVGGEAAYKASRTSLPAVTISVVLNHRREGTSPEEREAVHNGGIQLDFDRKDHLGMTVAEIRAIVEAHPSVVHCSVSTSGNGVKAIGRCPASIDSHKGSWHAFNDYFSQRGLTLDPSTIDYGRLCYVSFDPTAFTREDAVEIEPWAMPDRAEVGGASEGDEDPEHVRQVLTRVVEKIGSDLKRNQWLHICACTKDAVGAELAAEIMDDLFPPREPSHQSATDVMPSLKGIWATLWKYGIDPVDHAKDFDALPDLSEGEGPPRTSGKSSIVWGVNSFPMTVPPETVLLGNSWLRRGDIAHLVSTAGAGKSVAMTQSAMAWALGLPYFGIRPPQPLRILLFSGEDDGVTLGQCRAGFLEHSKIITGQQLTMAELEPLDSMLRTEFSREHVGDKFHVHLDRLLKQDPADLVIVNPLLSYVGGEIVACASTFLRAGLMPVLDRHNCGALLAHHTGKMSKEGWDNTDDTYSGIGGGEVANVPRTILVLRPTKAEGLHVVNVCKRKTTGWRDEEGKHTSSFFVKQSSDPERPAWIPVSGTEAREMISGCTPPGSAGTSRRKVTPGNVVEALQSGPMKRQDLIAVLRAKCVCSEKPAKDAIGAAQFDDLISTYEEKNPNGGNPIKWFQLPAEE